MGIYKEGDKKELSDNNNYGNFIGPVIDSFQNENINNNYQKKKFENCVTEGNNEFEMIMKPLSDSTANDNDNDNDNDNNHVLLPFKNDFDFDNNINVKSKNINFLFRKILKIPIFAWLLILLIFLLFIIVLITTSSNANSKKESNSDSDNNSNSDSNYDQSSDSNYDSNSDSSSDSSSDDVPYNYTKNYYFKLMYYSSQNNETISLFNFNSTFAKYIIKIEIEGDEFNPWPIFPFQYKGNHLVYFHFNESYKIKSMNSAFKGIERLLEINALKNITTLEDIGSMFEGCINLKSVNLSTFDTSGVTNMAHMFQNCSSLTSIDLSNFNNSNVKDVKNMEGMFYGCSSLSSIDISNIYIYSEVNLFDMLPEFGMIKTNIPTAIYTNIPRFWLIYTDDDTYDPFKKIYY